MSLKEVEDDLREAFRAGLKDFIQSVRILNNSQNETLEQETNALVAIPVIVTYLEQVKFKKKF
jgi:hypothetical protein